MVKSPILRVHDAHSIYQTLFAVPMTCQSCINDVSDSLYKLGGILKVEANLKDQLVSIEGTGRQHQFYTTNLTIQRGSSGHISNIDSAAPSAIVAAIQQTGRDAILRGSGGSNST
jgi:copper chaperone for superoxide dismutase